MSVISLGYTPRDWQRAMHLAMAAKKRGVLVIHRRAGKTVGAVMHAIDRALTCPREEPRYAYVAPMLKQVKAVAWSYLKRYARPIPGCEINESELHVSFMNAHNQRAQVRLYGADNPDAMRGIYLDGAVLDEVSQLSSDLWDSVLLPALADRDGWALLMGTPDGINLLSQLYNLALRDPLWHACLYTVYDTGALTSEMIASLKHEMTETAWRREMLCDFTASSDEQLISFDAIQAASKRQGPVVPYEPLILGVDVGRFGSDPSVLFWRQGRNATWSPERHHGQDTMHLAGRVAYLIGERKPAATFIDQTGIGAGVIDRLRALGLPAIGVDFGSKPSGLIGECHPANKRAEMYVRMRDWLNTGGAICPDAALMTQLAAVRYGYDNDNRLLLEKKDEMRKRIKSSPDEADALALTFAHPVQTLSLIGEGQSASGFGVAEMDYDPFSAA